MPGACQLSGNVVPAVGKGEGATPRRMEYLAITRFKNFYLISTNNSHIFYARFSHKFLSDGALPLLASPHGGQIPPCPLYLTAPPVARGSRGVTLVAGCTLRLPRRYCIGEAD